MSRCRRVSRNAIRPTHLNLLALALEHYGGWVRVKRTHLMVLGDWKLIDVRIIDDMNADIRITEEGEKYYARTLQRVG